MTRAAHYDVVIVGGAIYGFAIAWFLATDPDFDGRVLVVERDPTYARAGTSLTNSCIRQQFSDPLNVRISQFGAAYIKDFRAQMGLGDDVPHLALHSFGYMYLADTPAFADALLQAQQMQVSFGAATRHMMPDDIAQAYPFYQLDDIIAGNHNTVDEGYFDGGTLFDWWKRGARQKGVTYVTDTVVGLDRTGDRITAVHLMDGGKVGCDWCVNCAGTRGAQIAQMAGIALPVEPRKRYSFVFKAETPLDRDLPLTIDPSGVHVRQDGAYYLAGCPPDDDPAVDHDDFGFDHSLWENKVWPAIANRVPAFEKVKVVNSWVGHYDYNLLDQNAVLGPHPQVANFVLANGFSGHGLQQSPAIGRGLAERIVHGAYRTLDLSPLSYDRITANAPIVEKAII
ncbi:FAD-binding oxidoreductase [Loktanella sp. SALINAS62]|uniref:NAD(P)/FAD-dependent oxidoreductase n=1 Tax=Loktanella sp. SALINAS62 TaxID=2706124 RepID=UPI001B8C7935|nr:FAD-binding oxidoreductase [Loktanella sp. SALINAS62]MBS1302347.1 FAD-binding oxidoreductase [Loktanella sp. SALINAS62]